MSGMVRAVLALVAGLALVLGGAACSKSESPSAPTSSSQAAAAKGGSSAPKPGPRSSASSSAAPAPKGDAPQRVKDTLAHIDAGDWPDAAHAPGTHGGDPFGNREGRLPSKGAGGKPVSYREWDVNPKKPGQGRDAERIVTGDDGSAWYTLDHYDHFTRIR